MRSYHYKSPSALSKILVLLLVFGAVVNFIGAISSFGEYSLLVSYLNGADISDDVADANDNRQAAIGMVQAVLYLGTVVVWGMWTYRMSANAHSIKGSFLSIKPGWAVGYYFIPILLLWKPYQAITETYNAFVRHGGVKGSTVIFPVWWTAWIASNIVSRILYRHAMSAEEIDELIQASMITACSDAFDVILTVLALVMVLRVTNGCTTYKENLDANPPVEDRDESISTELGADSI